ncbi:hypothetical protein Tco_1311681, partial [Tanacetum coccineum]
MVVLEIEPLNTNMSLTLLSPNIINNVRYINAKVAGKPVTISKASIRSDLHFNDVDGIDSLNNQAIFDAIKLMGSQLKLAERDQFIEGTRKKKQHKKRSWKSSKRRSVFKQGREQLGAQNLLKKVNTKAREQEESTSSAAQTTPTPTPTTFGDDETNWILTSDPDKKKKFVKEDVLTKLELVSSPEEDYLVVYRVNGNFRAFKYLMEVDIGNDQQDWEDWSLGDLYEGLNYCKELLDFGLKVEELAIPEQTATGKGISNPLMAGSLPKTTKPTRLIHMWAQISHSCKGLNVARLGCFDPAAHRTCWKPIKDLSDKAVCTASFIRYRDIDFKDNLFVLKWCDEDLSKSSKDLFISSERFCTWDSARHKTQGLGDSTSSSNSLYSVFFISDHYMEPTEFEIQEMFKFLLLRFIFLIVRNGGQFEYWKAGLVVVLIMCGDIVKDSNSYLKSRGSIEDFVSFREMITSQLQGKLWLYDEVRVDNRPSMLDKTQYSSWASRMLLYIKAKENRKLLIDLVLNGPFKYGTLAKDLNNTNFDHLYSYLRQHEVHADGVRLMKERFSNPLALVEPVAIHSSLLHHQSYQPPDVHQPSQASFPLMDSGPVVLSFIPSD